MEIIMSEMLLSAQMRDARRRMTACVENTERYTDEFGKDSAAFARVLQDEVAEDVNSNVKIIRERITDIKILINGKAEAIERAINKFEALESRRFN